MGSRVLTTLCVFLGMFFVFMSPMKCHDRLLRNYLVPVSPHLTNEPALETNNPPFDPTTIKDEPKVDVPVMDTKVDETVVKTQVDDIVENKVDPTDHPKEIDISSGEDKNENSVPEDSGRLEPQETTNQPSESNVIKDSKSTPDKPVPKTNIDETTGQTDQILISNETEDSVPKITEPEVVTNPEETLSMNNAGRSEEVNPPKVEPKADEAIAETKIEEIFAEDNQTVTLNETKDSDPKIDEPVTAAKVEDKIENAEELDNASGEDDEEEDEEDDSEQEVEEPEVKTKVDETIAENIPTINQTLESNQTLETNQTFDANETQNSGPKLDEQVVKTKAEENIVENNQTFDPNETKPSETKIEPMMETNIDKNISEKKMDNSEEVRDSFVDLSSDKDEHKDSQTQVEEPEIVNETIAENNNTINQTFDSENTDDSVPTNESIVETKVNETIAENNLTLDSSESQVSESNVDESVTETKSEESLLVNKIDYSEEVKVPETPMESFPSLTASDWENSHLNSWEQQQQREQQQQQQEEQHQQREEQQQEVKDPIVDTNSEKHKHGIEEQQMGGWLEGMVVANVISDIIPDEIEFILREFQVSAQLAVITFIIAFNWCLMKILLSVFNSSRKENELRNICCKAERQIYYFEAEKTKMQNDIDRERERAQTCEERMQMAERRLFPLEKEFAKIKVERDQLVQKVTGLEIELESAAEAASEANRLLSDFLTSQRENVNLSSDLEALQQKITKQAEIVAKYESTAKQKEKENRELKDKYQKLSSETERIKKLLNESEHNLKVIRNNNEELKASKNELNSTLNNLQEEYARLQTSAEEFSQKNEQLLANVQELTEELNLLREQNNNKDLEIESLKDILTKVRKPIDNNSDDDAIEDDDQIDSENCDKSLNDIYDIVKMQIQVKNLTNDKKEYMAKLEDVSLQLRQLSDNLKSLEEDNQTLKSEKETALQERFKAQTELEVLTKYYKEKELEFGKEIGVHHIRRKQKEEDADSMATQLATYEEENVSLRSQLQSMKKEIEDTERKYKSQINQLEKQVHENWILARNSQRQLDEAKTEASVLRQTLTMSVKSPVDGYGNDSSFMDDSASSISDHFVTNLPPPPPPPLPPPPMMPHFNPMMPPMHMHYNEESDPSAWNQGMNPMAPVPPIPQPFPHVSSYNQIPTDVPMNMNHPQVSYPNSQPVSYAQQMAHQWESGSQVSNRDTYSPVSHRSTSSPHPQFNMYSQANNRYSSPMTNQMTSPMASNAMNNQYQNSVSSVTSPLVHSTPTAQPVNVFSEPIPSHWTQPHQPNGNITNLNYSHNSFNESDTSSRPESRSERTDNSFHTSMV